MLRAKYGVAKVRPTQGIVYLVAEMDSFDSYAGEATGTGSRREQKHFRDMVGGKKGDLYDQRRRRGAAAF